MEPGGHGLKPMKLSTKIYLPSLLWLECEMPPHAHELDTWSSVSGSGLLVCLFCLKILETGRRPSQRKVTQKVPLKVVSIKRCLLCFLFIMK